MAKSHLTLDEELLVEFYGDAIRTDVFPGRGYYSVRTLTAGNPRDSFYFVDDKGRTILLFNLYQNRVTSIYSPRKVSEVLNFVEELALVDPNLSNYLRSQLSTRQGVLGEIQIDDDEHELIFKPYSNRLYRVLEYDRKKSGEALEVLLSYGLYRLPISRKSTYKGDLSQVVTVVQKEYAVISGKLGDKRVANTFGLTDCIGLVLHDVYNQVASVAHIDGSTNVAASIPSLINDLSKAGGKVYQARLFGGYKRSARQIVELLNELERYGIEIVEADILEGARSRAIGISAYGELYYNVFEDNDPTMGARMIAAGVSMNVPLRCHYKP
jgi:chemotaxis receptor (MCP) glutamine deamidase CheD